MALSGKKHLFQKPNAAYPFRACATENKEEKTLSKGVKTWNLGCVSVRAAQTSQYNVWD